MSSRKRRTRKSADPSDVSEDQRHQEELEVTNGRNGRIIGRPLAVLLGLLIVQGAKVYLALKLTGAITAVINAPGVHPTVHEIKDLLEWIARLL